MDIVILGGAIFAGLFLVALWWGFSMLKQRDAACEEADSLAVGKVLAEAERDGAREKLATAERNLANANARETGMASTINELNAELAPLREAKRKADAQRRAASARAAEVNRARAAAKREAKPVTGVKPAPAKAATKITKSGPVPTAGKRGKALSA